jgi:hypothetical protein
MSIMMTILEMLMIGSDKGHQAAQYVSSTRAYTLATGISKQHIDMCMAAGEAYLNNKKNKAK